MALTAANAQSGDGAYVAFMDISLGITTPLTAALAAVQGVGSVYVVGSMIVLLSLVVVFSC